MSVKSQISSISDLVPLGAEECEPLGHGWLRISMVVLLLLLLLRAGSAWACSVCQPGDPVFSAEGNTAQRAGTFSLFLDTQQYAKESGALPHEEEGEDPGHGTESNRIREVSLFASWAPTTRLTLAARLPYKWIRKKKRGSGGLRCCGQFPPPPFGSPESGGATTTHAGRWGGG